MTLPTLDLSLSTHGNASERQELASRLLDSLSEHGFVKLVGHGVSDERIGELFRWVSWSDLWKHLHHANWDTKVQTLKITVVLNTCRIGLFSPFGTSISWPLHTLAVRSRREGSRASELRVALGFTGKGSLKLSFRKISATRGYVIDR